MERRKIHGGTAASSVKKSIETAKKMAEKDAKAVKRIEEDVQGTISRLIGA